jgi:hypothetical protein
MYELAYQCPSLGPQLSKNDLELGHLGLVLYQLRRLGRSLGRQAVPGHACAAGDINQVAAAFFSMTRSSVKHRPPDNSCFEQKSIPVRVMDNDGNYRL